MLTLLPKNHPSHDVTELLRELSSADPVRQFEAAFAKEMGAPFGIAFPFCRSAVRACLQLPWLTGNVVLLPAYSCSVIPAAICLARREPRFLDISLRDYNTPADHFSREVDGTVGAVIATRMYGNPTDVGAISAALPASVLLIEDNALSLQPAFRAPDINRPVASAYSFFFNKHLSTMQGGMIVTHSASLATQLRTHRDRTLHAAPLRSRMRFCLRFVALCLSFTPLTYALANRLRKLGPFHSLVEAVENERLEFPASAEERMHALQARLGLGALRQVHARLTRRRYLATRYQTLFEAAGIATPPLMDGSFHSHFPLRVQRRDERGVRERMYAAGVEAGRVFDYSCAELPLFRRYVDKPLPNAALAAREIITLPTYPSLSDSQQERVVDAVGNALRP